MTANGSSQQKTLLFAGAVAVRFALAAALPGLPDFLSGRVEISTPVTGFKRLQEGLFLYNHGVSPYDGGVFHQAPLLLSFFSISPDFVQSPLISLAIYTALDCLIASLLMQIVRSGAATQSQSFSSPRRHRTWSPLAVAASYLLNPFTILTCLGRPTSVFTTFFVLLATAKACSGAFISCTFALALAAYTSLHPALLIAPMALLCHDRLTTSKQTSNKNSPSLATFGFQFVLAFSGFWAILLGLSYFLMQDWSFINSVYGTRLLLPDLTPNVGLWWYFFIEMFDSFRSFFLGVFWLHMASYSPVITIRLQKQPLAAVVLMCGVFVIFQPYANVGDAGAFMAMLTLYGHAFENYSHLTISVTRYAFTALSTLLYSALLGPAFYYLWIYAGSGNANFFYAITLVWTLGLVVVTADVLWAILRDEWETERPEMKGQEARQI
ncbi:PIG-U-domain-containing protein [Myriangium duriaei CBS 260.36]|uniref:PIG-U-domain-containing protein n=1 Tax=Myriangium duriaei CBS 260.36 TaxID=1168546 RepID=A0A9P4MG87_9PEZI|nr:PIG-U-domain-containing protein [Myriangium duriaei CBS 260.36]